MTCECRIERCLVDATECGGGFHSAVNGRLVHFRRCQNCAKAEEECERLRMEVDEFRRGGAVESLRLAQSDLASERERRVAAQQGCMDLAAENERLKAELAEARDSKTQQRRRYKDELSDLHNLRVAQQARIEVLEKELAEARQENEGLCWHCVIPDSGDPERHVHEPQGGHWHHYIDPGDGLPSPCKNSAMLERIFARFEAMALVVRENRDEEHAEECRFEDENADWRHSGYCRRLTALLGEEGK